MSDYTPTTDDVRESATCGHDYSWLTDEQFDRWLASVKADAWDEGYREGISEAHPWVPTDPPSGRNPHREGK